MKKLITSIAIGAVAWSAFGTHQSLAQAPLNYSANDLLLFFQNPQGTVGNDQVVVFSLGNVQTNFRDLATPTNPNYGSTTAIGNIAGILTSTFGANWTSQSSTIFGGAAGQAGSTAALNNGITNGDFARTVYVTKPISFDGFAHYNPTNTATAGNISSSNNTFVAPVANPSSIGVGSTLIDNNNPFTPTNNPGLAYGSIQNGVMGAVQTGFSAGGLDNVVLALNVFRVANIETTRTNSLAATNWHNVNNIQGGNLNVYNTTQTSRSDLLGTVYLQDNGDVSFQAVPEPSSALLFGLGALMAFLRRNRRNA